jgi:PiT family inorganic phosphate transporter
MVEPLIVVGLGVAVFVGFNIGGSSTGVAFGPAVGSRIVRKVTAGALFTLFAFLGAWTVGRNVIETMSSGIVDAAVFTPEASVGVLFFTGLSLLVSNIYGVPASTSMTAVGAIVGLGLATGTLNAALMFTILSAWVVAPLLAFGVGVIVGRYLYPYLDAKFAFGRLENPLVGVDTDGRLPRPRLDADVAPRDLFGSALVVVIACYMGFSAGASNAANAVAPLVGNGSVEASPAILLAVASIGLGGFTIARRTLATVGDDITDLPILAALIVSTVGATIITVLSYLGIPASLAVSTTCCIIGLGWGRASRARTLVEMAAPTAAATGAGHGGARAEGDPGNEPATETPEFSTGALSAPPGTDPEDGAAGPTVGDLAEGEVAEEPDAEVAPIGEERPEELPAESLFDPAATARIVSLWVITPALSVTGAYLLFSLIA